MSIATTAQRLPLHPFVCGLLVNLIGYSEVIDQVLPQELIPCIVILELVLALVLAVFWIFLRDLQKAALCTTSLLLVTVCYTALTLPLDDLSCAFTGAPASPALDMLAFVVAVWAACSVLCKSHLQLGKHALHINHGRLNALFNLVAIFLLVPNVLTICGVLHQQQAMEQKFAAHFDRILDGVRFDQSAPKPDVYYFMLDGFPNSQSLKDFFNYDNKEFIDFLQRHGFSVAAAAHSNYDRTELSMASAFCMQYIDWVPETFGVDCKCANELAQLLADSPVLKLFRQLGYRIVNLSSGSGATDWLTTADTNVRGVYFNHWIAALSRLTPLSSLDNYYPVLRDAYAEMRLAPSRKLAQLVAMPGPKFVMVHTELSHAPCIFRADGRRIALATFLETDWGTPEQYVEQIKFCQGQVESWIAFLLAQPGPKPVLIIQSDHGPQLKVGDQDNYFNERMRNFTACYLPPANRRLIYDTMTPVNTFRVVFNAYFKTAFPLLPDRSMCAPVYPKVFEWRDVTTRLRYPEIGK